MKKTSWKIPHAFVIVFIIVVIAGIATYIVPGGHFERKIIDDNGTKRELILKDTFKFEKNKPQGFEIFQAPLKGFIRLSEIIGFIFIVGGAFFIFQKTGAMDGAINEIVKRMKGKEKLIIVIVMFIFSFFGAFFGMCEEAIPFVLIFVPLALALGYDSITGLCFSFLAAGVGFATAILNPFTVQIAQKCSEIPTMSGWEYRAVIWLFCTAFTIFWVIRYAEKVKKNPELSLTYEQDKKRREELAKEGTELIKFNKSHAAVMAVLLGGVVLLIFGVIKLKWEIVHLSALFMGMGVAAGLLGGLHPNDLAKGFIDGAKDMAGAALIVGFGGGIIVLLKDGGIMDTILYGMYKGIGNSVPIVSAYIMYGFQMVLNFFIPSGSTKAILTMPLFAPLADLTGITRQTAVLAYQFGDGFTHMLFPTSGVTIATLALAKVPFEKWFKWLLPLEIIFVIFSLLLLIWPVLTHWTGL